MKNIKIIELKSGLSLFLLAMMQICVMFIFVFEAMMPLQVEMKQHIWTYFNVITIIVFLIALKMGKSTINEVVKNKRFRVEGSSTLFRLCFFIFSLTIIIIHIHYNLVYENTGLSFTLIAILILVISALLSSLFVSSIPSLFFGVIYGYILKKISKPLTT